MAEYEGICQQNIHFNMYTTISKPQEGSTRKDSHAKCFITTNSTAKLSPGAVNRGEFESVFPVRVCVIFPLWSI